jgi:hypothetical protein
MGEACFGGSFVPGVDQVAGDVDAYDFGSQTGERDGGGAVAAAEIERA